MPQFGAIYPSKNKIPNSYVGSQYILSNQMENSDWLRADHVIKWGF